MTPLSSPTDSQRDGSAEHSTASHQSTDRPERSRNAKGMSSPSSHTAPPVLTRYQPRRVTGPSGRRTSSRYNSPAPVPMLAYRPVSHQARANRDETAVRPRIVPRPSRCYSPAPHAHTRARAGERVAPPRGRGAQATARDEERPTTTGISPRHLHPSSLRRPPFRPRC